MGIDLGNGYRELLIHKGHKIELATYAPAVYESDGKPAMEPSNVAIECVTCGCVLLDFDHPEEDQDESE